MRMHFKKMVYIFSFVMFILTLSSCDFVSWGISKVSNSSINETFGFDLPKISDRIDRYISVWQETSVFEIWDLSKCDPSEKLKDLKQWHSFPIQEEDYNKFYVKYKTFSIRDKDKIFEFPNINYGYYLYSEEVTEDFSYIFAIFDSLDKKLYFYYYDTLNYGMVYEIDSAIIFGFDFPYFHRKEEHITDISQTKDYEKWDFYFTSKNVDFEELKQWHKLPLSPEYKEKVYGTGGELPEFSVYYEYKVHNEVKKEYYTFPYINEGYYMYTEEKTQYYDFLFAMYDEIDKIIYIFYNKY